MLFPTIEFALFFLVTFVVSWALARWPTWRKAVLAVASYVFYGYWNWRYTLLLFECTAVNYVLALWMESVATRSAQKKILIGGIVFNLGLLGYFKYWGFFLSSVNDVLLAVGLMRDAKVLEVLLPAGVSFFTFQALSYLVDIYRGEIKAVTSPVDMLLFKAFFPQLVAGPIVRAKDFIPQLAKPVDASDIRATRAFLLIGIGLFKKIVIAHYLAVELVNPVFEAPASFSTWDLLFGVYGYAIQIYCDFSAYTDMAIGTALLFGYQFPVNFNQPYKAESLQDFWRRWHISLSSWLRDYLYIPLGGSRQGKVKGYRNMFITMLLGGLWHGAAWNFVVWGCLHGAGQVVEKALRDRGIGLPKSRLLRTLVTFHFICLTWIFFAADGTGTAFEFLRSFGNVGVETRMLTPFTGFLLLLGVGGQLVPGDMIDRLEEASVRVPLVAQAAALAIVVLTIGAMGPGALAPFIYFRF
jgi:D-alanyl-lipoteichoic acid acyltransferase DltB (MBOAT superfamily)